MQIGSRWFSVRPELGVFYDHAALGLRKNDVIFVPAITLMSERGRDYAQSGTEPSRPRTRPWWMLWP